MKILHYSLGFPPYRTGGMTKFCIDLMQKQRENGNIVGLVWPGKISVLGEKVKIKRRPDNYGIESYEVINPLPISLNGGIANIKKYTASCVNPEEYEEFLEKFRPDIIHLHTLMGIHKEFVENAKERGIKVVFTTHDYFGICPKVTMFRNGRACETVEGYSECSKCNSKALDIKKIMLLQSPMYRKIKDLSVVKKARSKFRGRFFLEDDKDSVNVANRKNDYIQLRKFYADILCLIDKVHFNSTLSRDIYCRYIPEISDKGIVIHISHNEIKNNKKIKKIGDIINITYLAPLIESKGFNMLLSALDELWNEGERWFCLNLYYNNGIARPYAVMHPRYKYSELEKIFDNTDVLVAPSLWYETFGYTVLEALSFGVPVIVTENVGAKNLVKRERFGWIINPDKEELKKAILYIKDKEQLMKCNKNIVKEFNVDSVNKFVQRIEEMYKSLLGD